MYNNDDGKKVCFMNQEKASLLVECISFLS